MPDWKKLIEGKIALATRGAKPGKVNANERIPAGQTEVKNFPTLDLGIRPDVTIENWRLQIYGLVGKELTIDWAQFQAMNQITDVSDFHCVTRWSQLDMNWQGVLARDLIAMTEPLPTAKYVTLHGYDGYTTNLPLDALLDDDVIIAHSVLGAPLTQAHGGPVRIVVPKRYAWKGAKWLKAIELHAFDRPGFWEVRGYHNDADPWKEERFSDD
ncbi:MAG: sulfite oxidase-like oxidoreductase [Methylotenera sp.]|uniref:molybdopterin-dependent oxidoreductase n=1 Tax=Methylotenera sp. TaxID=2051956 RepID=UPI000D4F39FC|nr:molybdopterin-dependent oxidoreductase [Methylotenera sp.]PPC81169.1 MAG: sulfite oxidase-like oxidoreductase [Methylotenera sp.]